MQHLKHKLILSCKKASELIDKKSVLKLTFRENLMLHVHTSICDACTQYEKQSRIIDGILKEHLQKSNPEQVPQFVNNELKMKVFSRLKNNS